MRDAALNDMAEVINRHHLLPAEYACSCDQMFYDLRASREDTKYEHALHIEKELIDAGFGKVAAE